MADGPDGGRSSIPNGFAVWLMDRTEAGVVSQGSLLYHMVDGPD